jgi:hypothetical protein
MLKQKLMSAGAAAALILAASAFASAATCSFTTVKKTMTLNADCSTTASIVIPNGITLDGAGHTITALDPAGDHFRGGILQSGGAVANVTSVTITASGLAPNACDAGADRLRGILFDGASGSITNVKVLNVNQGVSGCQEGNGIEVRNFGSSPVTIRVTIDGNTVSAYQKNGITANGDTDATITNNTVEGLGPISYIAQNGIQIGFGATGMVKRNNVSGNEYTGNSTVATGILLVAGPFYDSDYSVGDQIDQNTISENDVGVYVSELDADGNPAPTATNVKIVNNTISKSGVTNFIYQAAVSDQGNNDKIVANTITGAGYDPNNVSTFAVDADPAFTNRAKVHANK